MHTFVFWKIQQQNVFIKGFSKVNFSNKNMKLNNIVGMYQLQYY
jgi:hypothetical protein